MAVLVLEVFGRKLHSSAEQELAERFRRELPDDSVVMHSVGLVRHTKKRWAEADFVLISPQGVFCLEVKGGRVRRIGGEWTFTDRFGHVDTRYEGPFDQAGGAAGALQSWLADAKVRRDDGSLFQVGYGVMTPHCVLDQDGPDVEPQLLLDQRNAGDPLLEFVTRIGTYWQARLGISRLSVAEVDQLRDAIRPDFDAAITRSLALGIVEDQLVRFTDEQLEVLEAVNDNQRIIIRGSAGTGKSLLAVREALRLADADQSVLLVGHTRALVNVLQASVNGRVSVCTFASLANRIIADAGRTDELPDATEDALFETFMPQLAADILTADPEVARVDAIVVDEAQDLLKGLAFEVLDLMLVGGLAAGCWRVFLDPNQNIFGRVRRESLDLLERGDPVRFRLTKNCRNTQEVTEFAALLSGASDLAKSRISGPEVRVSDTWDEPWESRTASSVDKILTDGTSTSDVVVLVPTRNQLATLISFRPELFDSQRGSGRVLVSTVAAFKGLEATAVVLAGLPSLDKPYLRQAAYVGATRAKVLLSVVLPSEAKTTLDRRIADYSEQVASQIRGESG